MAEALTQDPWADFPDAPVAEDPWADFPDAQSETITEEELSKYSVPDPNRKVTPSEGLSGRDAKIAEIEGFAESQSNPEVMNRVNDIKLSENPDNEKYSSGDFEKDLAAKYEGGFYDKSTGNDPVDALYEETVVRKTQADDKAKADYQFFASGPNAKNARLPENFEPTTSMYDNVEDPQKLYDYLVSQSNGTTATGRPTFNNRIIPEPTDYTRETNLRSSIENPLTAVNPTLKPISDLTGDTIRESGKDAIVKVAAVIDEVNNYLGYPTNLTKTAEEGIADPAKSVSVQHQLAKDVIRTGASLVAGAKMGGKTADTGSKLKGITNASGIDKWILSTAGALSIDALTANVDNPNLLVGEDAALPVIPGNKINAGDRDSTKVLKKTGDYALDNLATAPIALGAAELGAKAFGYGKNLVSSTLAPWFKGDAAIAREEAERFMKLAGVDTTEKLKKVVDDLRTHGEVNLTFPDGTVAPIKINRSSMSAIEEGARATGDNDVANAALDMERSARKQNILLPSFETVKQQPVNALRTGLNEAVDARGGKDAIEQTKNVLANQAIKKIDDTSNVVTKAKSQADSFVKSRQSEAAGVLQKKTADADMRVAAAGDIVEGSKKDLEIAEQGLRDLYANDKIFKKSIDELSEATGIDIHGANRNEATQKFLPKLVEGVRRMKQHKNDLYMMIPDDADIDEQSFLKAYGDAIDVDALPADTKKMIAQHLGGDADNIETLTFGKIYKMLPDLNKAIIETARDSSSTRDAKLQALNALRDNINDVQMNHLIDNGDGDVVTAAMNARDYYRDIYSKFARQKNTPITQLFDEFDNSWFDHLGRGPRDPRGKLTTIEDIGDNFAVQDTAQNVAEEGMKDRVSGSSKQIDQFIKHPDTGEGLEDSFLDIHRGEIADAIAVLRSKGKEPTGADIADILKTKGVSLKNSYPEFSAGIEDFIKRLDETQGNVAKAKDTLKSSEDAFDSTKKVSSKLKDKAQKEFDEFNDNTKKISKDAVKKVEKQAKSDERQVWQSALGKFIEKSPDGTGKAVPAGNGYNVLRKMLNAEGNENKIKSIATAIKKSGDKDAQKGLEAALYDQVSEVLSESNLYKVKGAKASKLLNENKSLKSYGDIVFGGDTEDAVNGRKTFENVLKVVDIVNNEQLKNVSTVGSLADARDQTVSEAKKAVNYLVGQIFGRFNSTSLRLTGTAGRFIDTTNPEEKRKGILTAIHSHPDYLADVLELVKEGTKKNGDPELRRALILTGILTGKEKLAGDEELEKKIPEGVLPGK